ncbi:hypothetical protein D9757_011317 [Collybiopsis confluens]|uniref:Uncharacterized protein n=1 Tax=Collybiopsis confluens TaxID=2823264 RepID=A0A8H5GGW7_9AGAR|nr:hypothetical protein D9757_011317 [Collybiopsis confluens]
MHREPALTIHNIKVSGPNNPTVIPGSVKMQLSLCIVPDHDLNTISGSLCRFLRSLFDEMHSPNELKLFTPLPKSEVLLESIPDALVHTKQGKHKNLFDFDANKTSDTIEIHADNPHGDQREKLSDSSSIPTSGKSEVHFGVFTYYLTDISRNQINKNLLKVPLI